MSEPTNTPEQPLSFGQQAVGTNFNPSQDEDVAEVKQLCAQLIDKVESIKAARPNQSYLTNTVDGEAVRQIMSAQMWAVKAVTLDK